MTELRRRRTLKLPTPPPVHRDTLDAFMESIGWDANARKAVTSVRINAHRIEVDVAPRPDVKLTVRQPVVWADDDE